MGGKRAEMRARTRQHLIDTTLRLVEAQGVATLRTLTVAQLAGTSHGTVFVHFATREDLLAAAVETFVEGVVERLRTGDGGDLSLERTLERHLAAIAAEEDLYVSLVKEAPLLGAAAQAHWTRLQASVSLVMTPAFDAEIARGRIRDLPIHLLVNTWLALVHHYLINRDLFSPGESVVASKGPLLRQHMMSLLAP